VIVFPAFSALVSTACAILIGRDARRRPSPDKLAWIVAFALFSVAAGAEVVGSVAGWTPLLVRVYYVAGAMLVVGFLGLGQLYLLFAGRLARIGPGVALFMVVVAVALISDAPIASDRLATDGWHALERGPALIAVTVALNVGGTVIVVGGALYSAWQFWRRRIFRHRMIGCVLIALGTLAVASGGTLTRFGQPEYLYIAMAIGVTVIFAGYLEARRREAPVMRSGSGAGGLTARPPAPSAVQNGHAGSGVHADPAMAFLLTLIAADDAEQVAERCAFWSIEPEAVSRFDREQAHRVWGVRLRLPVESHAAFDRLPASTQIQLADLYLEILAPGVDEARTGQANLLKPNPN
jgi:hypothetical protein